MYGTEKMKNKFLRERILLLKKGAIFGFRGLSFFCFLREKVNSSWNIAIMENQ